MQISLCVSLILRLLEGIYGKLNNLLERLHQLYFSCPHSLALPPPVVTTCPPSVSWLSSCCCVCPLTSGTLGILVLFNRYLTRYTNWGQITFFRRETWPRGEDGWNLLSPPLSFHQLRDPVYTDSSSDQSYDRGSSVHPPHPLTADGCATLPCVWDGSCGPHCYSYLHRRAGPATQHTQVHTHPLIFLTYTHTLKENTRWLMQVISHTKYAYNMPGLPRDHTHTLTILWLD